ncbi:mercury resistance system transport protein MerF [Roseomonas mucosa]|uniref:mercury resistance system transport protein MerF n=1 Tax=Roseomonas mucosa TaxID=207340 RepID=UPI001EF5248E|nr:mercury resistance system transport protein MerF [Roseomonas mucosa]MCG7354492.1 mercury resistance system transport protein MerF [Roseomonas mucosa]MDT8356845.1 mercury resistance system transport protein MerF [Roseomonas mucosa]
MTNRSMLRLGIGGTAIAALCCATPFLALLLGAVGLSALVGWLDVVLLPAIALFLGITIWALIRRLGQKEGC